MVKFNFSIDGNYAFHIFRYLCNTKRLVINWRRLELFLKEQFGRFSNQECLINAKGYYIGNPDKIDTRVTAESRARKEFQDTLIMANIQPYLIQKQGLKEAGVDIRLALEAYKHSLDPDVKFFALFAGDGDFCTLFDELHDMGIHIMLIGAEIPANSEMPGTFNSAVLESMADYRMDLLTMINTRPDIFDYYGPQPSNHFSDIDQLPHNAVVSNAQSIEKITGCNLTTGQIYKTRYNTSVTNYANPNNFNNKNNLIQMSPGTRKLVDDLTQSQKDSIFARGQEILQNEKAELERLSRSNNLIDFAGSANLINPTNPANLTNTNDYSIYAARSQSITQSESADIIKMANNRQLNKVEMLAPNVINNTNDVTQNINASNNITNAVPQETLLNTLSNKAAKGKIAPSTQITQNISTNTLKKRGRPKKSSLPSGNSQIPATSSNIKTSETNIAPAFDDAKDTKITQPDNNNLNDPNISTLKTSTPKNKSATADIESTSSPAVQDKKPPLQLLTADIALKLVKTLMDERHKERGLPVNYIFLADLGKAIHHATYATPTCGLKAYLENFPNIFTVGEGSNGHPTVALVNNTSKSKPTRKRIPGIFRTTTVPAPSILKGKPVPGVRLGNKPLI